MCGDGLSFTSIEAGPGPAVTPRQAVFVNDPSFQAPLLWRCLLLIGEGVKKEEPWHAAPLVVVVVVWRRPHTLPPVKVL